MPVSSEHDRPADRGDPAGRYPPGRPTPPSIERVFPTDAQTRRTRRGTRRSLVVREYEPLTGLSEEERRDLERFVLAQPTPEPQHPRRFVLGFRNGLVHAQNYVGIIETRRGTVIEILPKIDLANVRNETEKPNARPGERAGGSADSSTGRHEETRRVFLTMLRDWRGLGQAQFDAAGIRSPTCPLLRSPREPDDVGFDEWARHRRSVRCEPTGYDVFSDVPPSTNPDDDWARHRVDRSMRHYDTVMPWVGLFLFGRGLATFAGPYLNRALLFPMQEVFEDFVTAAVRRHQRRFTVRAQGPMKNLAMDGTGKNTFWLKPDIVLERGHVRFILDAKWKHLDPAAPNHGVRPDDAYQLFAYGRRYGCRRVVLVYPRTPAFQEMLRFRFVDDRDLELACCPFDVADPAGTVDALMRDLLR